MDPDFGSNGRAEALKPPVRRRDQFRVLAMWMMPAINSPGDSSNWSIGDTCRLTPYNFHIPNQPLQIIMLKGTELLDTIRTMESASRTEQCLACGYVRENGKPAFTSFYEAILEARGVTSAAVEKEELLTEYPDQKDTLSELLEDYDADAVKAFIEYFGEECLESFEDSYQGEMSGAEFAQQTDRRLLRRRPAWIR